MSEAGDEPTLDAAEAGDDPFALFDQWYREAEAAGLYLPDAMTLATASPDGVPSARMVLLKGYGPDGFVLFTNYGSRKAAELDANPRAALVLHWNTMHRQVRVTGRVERTSRAESEAYFRTRPRGSRVAAWASRQGAELEGRDALERRFARHEQEFADGDVPLPPFWGGYRVVPDVIEFWQGRANRMHDRLAFTREPGAIAPGAAATEGAMGGAETGGAGAGGAGAGGVGAGGAGAGRADGTVWRVTRLSP